MIFTRVVTFSDVLSELDGCLKLMSFTGERDQKIRS
jgi:hypothetical protein